MKRSKQAKIARKRAAKSSRMKKEEGAGESSYAKKLRLKHKGHHIGMYWFE